MNHIKTIINKNIKFFIKGYFNKSMFKYGFMSGSILFATTGFYGGYKYCTYKMKKSGDYYRGVYVNDDNFSTFYMNLMKKKFDHKYNNNYVFIPLKKLNRKNNFTVQKKDEIYTVNVNSGSLVKTEYDRNYYGI